MERSKILRGKCIYALELCGHLKMSFDNECHESDVKHINRCLVDLIAHIKMATPEETEMTLEEAKELLAEVRKKYYAP